jgi:argininosuccinate lyase
MNDSEDPLQPLVDMAFTDCVRALMLMEGVLSEAEFRTDKMNARAQGDFLTVTELADTLVRSTGISFHKAHTVVSGAVRALAGEFDRDKMVALVVRALKDEGVSPPEPDVLLRALDAENFVRIRTIPGGPAAAVLERAIAESRSRYDLDNERLSSTRERLRVASQELHAVSYALQGS